MAALDGKHPPNSLEAVVACLDAEADVIEVDITSLADTDFLLVHDATLDSETSGHGPVAACSAQDARELWIRWRGEVTSARVPRLGQVVEAMRHHANSRTRLQLDLKDARPSASDEPLRRLARLVEPIASRVSVSTNADWQLRHLRRLAPWLELGFDIQLYLDVPKSSYDGEALPERVGAYGYRDDHPLARERQWSAAEYLADRCAVLSNLAEGVKTMYLNYPLLIRSLDDGFNWAEPLHRRGIALDAWTLDVTNQNVRAVAARLVEAGVDQFTTNTPNELRSILTSARK
jgi:glycerophosphoryl diester phosphodiesterase